jgi:DNA-binding transcriptional MerR regulator/methylmalonyl-CoA mutase cobalamin-binding subunit
MDGAKQKHPIAVVSRRTGLSSHVIRAWETRYGAVSPERTPGNHRLYSDEDIQRLLTLKRATESGWSIGQLASLSTKELLALLAQDGTLKSDMPREESETVSHGEAQAAVQACLEAVERLDAAALWEALYRSSISLGQIAVIEEVVVPLMQALGAQWSEGSLRIVHEHAASAVIRTYLGDLLRSLEVSDSAPRAVSCTLEGERHEIGALYAAVGAALQGWKVQYLGPNLPWEEIARAVEIYDADLVLISVIMPPEQSRVDTELEKLRTFLPDRVAIIVGGRLPKVPPAVEGIEYIGDVRALRARLSAPGTG